MKKNLLIFDNSNLNESYAGTTTPLTFSFARRVYAQVYKEFSSVIGIDKKTIDENLMMYEEMIGFVGYRMYYNLLNWYKLISFIPGFKYNRVFLENMLGVSKTFVFETKKRKRWKYIELFLMLKQIFALIWEFSQINKNVKKFLKDFDNNHKKLTRLNLSKLSDLELINFYQKTEKQLCEKWRITIVNDLAVMIAAGLSKRLFEKWLPKEKSQINKLFSEIKGVESVKVSNNFGNIIREILKNEKFLKLFQSNSAVKILNKLKAEKSFKKLNKLIDNYLSSFGDRSPNELKLESQTYKNNPIFFITLLKNQLIKKELKNIRKVNKNEDSLNDLTTLRKLIMKKLIGLCVFYIRNREAARLRRSLVFGFARKVFLEIALRIYNKKIIKKEPDIYYLTVEEIIGIFNGTIVISNLKNLIDIRKKEYAMWADIELPQRIELESNQYLYQANIISKKNNKFDQNREFPKLKGLTCSIGKEGDMTTGEALVLKNFNPNVSYVGKILVTKQTDPGWTPVFPYLKGVIVERGGMLSHAAIVAREYGLPCITQVNKATDFIVNGSEIKIDTKNGVITVL